ncbi:glycosyl hydrolase family 18 protein [Desulfotomaculum copahuensis]|uniref:GH18 domain-containing protein n=1 Tax=Desulfotomaculum copahuensis TaxID=1838280 RepID=A0A1B7LEP1_9FIRM|nr:glycosyl hydrolase family 18 protein [Desulfotomaculum copahuensis]OAT81743.1 hypothetical protein A6M21_10075 [Desulfotomaculum copahuensis]
MQPKKSISFLVLGIFLCSMLFISPAAQAGQGYGSCLMQGDYGPPVTALQQQLKQLGYFQTTPTGYFGPVTAAAVTGLQAGHGLTADGIAGPLTEELIQKLLASPTPAGNNTASSGNTRTVMGFYTQDEGAIPSSYADLVNHGNALTSIAPFWYQVDVSGSGSLHTLDGVSNQDAEQVVATAHREKVKALALIYNMLYDSGADGRDVMHRVLVNPQNRRALVMNIYNLLRSRGFDGVEIDTENIYPQDGQLFSQFLTELGAQLHPAGYVISVALPAKLSNQSSGSWSDSFDYAAVGSLADQVVVMAYDEHGAYGGAGPVASIAWVEKIIRYTLTCVPAQKVLLGMPAYGFDWNYSGGFPRYLSFALAAQTANRYGAAINWDNNAQAPYFGYTDENGSWHQVWFENASSWAGKLDLVNKYNLGGIAIWRLGMEDPAVWPLLGEKFTIKK